MKWRSHAQITGLVADALELPDDLAELMIEASIYPDRHALKTVKKERGRHRVRRVRHHRASRAEVMRLLWRARRSYLIGEDEDAVWRLGRALHYIQDAHVHIGPFYSHHDQFEKEISFLAPCNSSIREGVERSIASPHFVRGCVDASVQMGDPQKALDHAALMSASIAGAVLGEAVDSPSLARRWRTTRLRHSIIVVPAAIGVLGLTAFWARANNAPHLLAVGVPISAAIVLADRSYAHCSDEAKWNGLV